ncbi:copper oxidase [Haloferax mediterranei ATCC 33500]|uniref:Copper-containing nitrite reductase n=1 Tax=Haloferax mediterranei (strain ATCC 33500 / DSM 1411 / JCM 8866 / NBRC 14739 / NCIMB 2177 / R-4) TaxID=523841 RepID=I3R1X4_HALMT|nr:multicopper oxidase domain-containing protein [Haloferax mediterranei]AFK18234.1 membrane protein Pan1 [Haloferax mediterranei ATCC 33500]AHZ22365.1 multicopper oxidase [Haloferax mediterranei ATCC 33500]EMA02495.1 membrane protein Pan1 [Haloferax mediterranei ATCC 33500]MDX5988322.1 multicopper oxidase domain-containing protein [Haloferax mediterranei ATCC 33500]QCQ74756.1 copper oxidase [Haloferax mediterranei ATCC 33500]
MPSLDYSKAADLTETLERRLADSLDPDFTVSRRAVLGGLGLAGGAVLTGLGRADGDPHAGSHEDSSHGKFGTVGEYRNLDFDPHDFLTQFNTGRGEQANVPQDIYEENGRTVREFEFTAVDTTVTVAPGIEFPAWAYNGQVPGPTLRVVEGDLIRLKFSNFGRHAHTVHPHLRNLNPRMDGVPTNGPGVIDTDESFTYEWIAQPAGSHFYHCHSLPLKEHIHRGLYGSIIVDPDPERVADRPEEYCEFHSSQITDELRESLVAEAKTRNHEYPENDAVNEMVMVMNGFDTNFDGDNEVYAVNTRAFAYGVGQTDGNGNWQAGETKHPIQIDKTKRQRVYLLNIIEFDPINSFHTHSQFFDYYDHGTTLTPTLKNVDTVMQSQAQRGIIELDYSTHESGLYMFHAHQSEFAELGWMSFFEVV